MANESLLLLWRQRWNGSLRRFLGRRVSASVDIEDLAQETYLRLLRARDLSDIRNPQAYLLRVASHVVSEWRTRQPPPGLVDPLDEQTLLAMVSTELTPDVALSRQDIERALQQVPPITRAVVLLKFRDGWQCKEIARVLQLTERQVRRHLTQGFERLRRALVD
jgi:RNA polymerase sigma-70 factor (ECF subfamily)